ncbi:putative redox protein [Pontibacter ummariensis]|uniref:Putative redox protein n=1 Tax=Pontibacter ummariensis TaxID=1610492 RepID=A0A239C8G9_9BACT|nr:OsmC family protein [Pontibacter ummariensis]PRY15424.1 putative redox protein [Pontibacter ummariensis]SNS15673.1 putative redox protein [Pontibacter ummariensis]
MSLTDNEGFVQVSADKSAPFLAKIGMEGQEMTIDESGIEQGVKTGPDPYDYILSALGACTVITLHMYAQRKSWPLERAEVSLRHERIHPSDCLNCEDKASKLNHVTKKLRLIGDLTAAQRQRLEAISSKCPVQRTLESGISVTTVLEV